MEKTYQSQNKKTNNFSYNNDVSYASIPMSYGQQYKGYHNDIKNKPFSQQDGIYLYDVYDQKQKILNESELQNFQKNSSKIKPEISINNISQSNNENQYPELNILDELNASGVFQDQNLNNTFNNNNGSNLSFDTNGLHNTFQNTSQRLNATSLLLNKNPKSRNFNYEFTKEFQKSQQGSQTDTNKQKKQKNQESFQYSGFHTGRTGNEISQINVQDLSQNEYYNTFKSDLANQDVLNKLNQSQTLNNQSMYQTADQKEMTFSSAISQTSFPIVKHKRNKKPLVLTRDAKSQSTLFSQIAKENIFTNISFTANKDYDYKYDLFDGLTIHLDMIEVTFPATQIKNLTLNYEIINKKNKEIIWQQDGHKIKYKDIYKQKIQIQHRQLFKNLPLDEDFYFIIYANYEIIDIKNRMETQFATFSIIPIFKNKGLNSGKHDIKFLQFCGSRHPVLSLEGYQFPSVEDLNCYIRICRPDSYLDQEKFGLKLQLKNNNYKINVKPYKQDQTIERKDREDIDGFWAQRMKKQREQQEQQQMKQELQNQTLTYQQKKKLELDNNKYNIPFVSFDLYHPSKFANFQTQIHRNPVEVKPQQGKCKIGKYY